MNIKLKHAVLLIFLLFIVLYLIIIIIHCDSEPKFNSAVKNYGLKCSRIEFIRLGSGIGRHSRFVFYRDGQLDTAAGINKCNDFRKFYFTPKQKLWFGFYADGIDAIMPVNTWEQFRVLQKYFPDSAAIMDTAYLY